ncbi:MAG TPA: hypothetical protein VFY49_11555 [Myxococcota bacterium]|nr:hypothetical protein [Myxococcota bacterium]
MAAIAERFAARRAHERLCYARLSDYARERPGLSPRQLQELARVHRALTDLPSLECALVANRLPWSKVRLLARVATRADEQAWIALAERLPTRLLEQEVRRSARLGDDDGEDVEPTTRIALRCTPAVRAKWDLVRELAERVAGSRLRGRDVLELVVAEACSQVAVAPESGAVPDEQRFAQSGRASEGARRTARAPAPGLPLPIAALGANLEHADAFELDRRLCQAVRLEQTLDAAMAPLLRRVCSAEYEWRGDYRRLPAYARDELGMSAGKARALLRLERGAELCPELRQAHRSGRLSWVKARCLLPLLLLDLPGSWRGVWVAWAERVTVRRLERDVERALLLRAGHDAAWHRCKSDPERAQDPIPPHERQLCAHDLDLEATEPLEWRVPRGVAALFAALRTRLSFEEMLDHALVTWLLRDPAAPRPDPVIERDGYRCLVPGCSSRRNLHDHHVTFRSAGGSDDPANRVTLCAFHHQRCLHAGRMRIRGRAPDALVFELGLRPGGAALARYRSGDIAA